MITAHYAFTQSTQCAPKVIHYAHQLLIFLVQGRFVFVFFAVTEAGIWLIKQINCSYMEDPVISRPVRGVASNEAEEAVASSLFCAKTCACIGNMI